MLRSLALATTFAWMAAGKCGLKTCVQLEDFVVRNSHYAYSGICAKPDCGRPVDFAAADAACKEMGARLCTMSEITHDVAKGLECNKDNTNVWTSTTCPGGHVSMAGSFVGSRESGKGPQCRDDNKAYHFVCCSSNEEEKACVTEEAEACDSDCCKDLEVTYNPVPCQNDFDCQSCVPLQKDQNGVYGCNPEEGENIHMLRLQTPEGEMCCSMDPGQTRCQKTVYETEKGSYTSEEGFCTLAPCMGESPFNPQWSDVRGDEWSRAMCKACHHNGCDQCMDGYFKHDQSSECVDCKVLKGCRNCQNQGCNQCLNNKQPKQCNMPGGKQNTCCDSGERTMCVVSTGTAPTTAPLPTSEPTTPTQEPTASKSCDEMLEQAACEETICPNTNQSCLWDPNDFYCYCGESPSAPVPTTQEPATTPSCEDMAEQGACEGTECPLTKEKCLWEPNDFYCYCGEALKGCQGQSSKGGCEDAVCEETGEKCVWDVEDFFCDCPAARPVPRNCAEINIRGTCEQSTCASSGGPCVWDPSDSYCFCLPPLTKGCSSYTEQTSCRAGTCAETSANCAWDSEENVCYCA